jgi:hypothetical protein
MSILCEMTLLDTERHELLAAFDLRSKQSPRPSLALDMLAHNVRSNSTVPIYVSHVGDLLDFAVDGNLEWLEHRLVHEYGLLRERRKAARESVASQEPTPCSARSETEAE